MTFSFDADMRSVARRNHEEGKRYLVLADCAGLARPVVVVGSVGKRQSDKTREAFSRDPLQPSRVEVLGSEVGETPVEGLA